MISDMGEMIFIGGTGRSGTTILSEAISNNNTIKRMPVEMRIHIDPGGYYDLFKAMTFDWDVYRTSNTIDNFCKFYNKLSRFSFNSYHNIKHGNLGHAYYSNLLEQYLEMLGVYREKRLWVGNSPLISKLFMNSGLPFKYTFQPWFYYSNPIDPESFFNFTRGHLTKLWGLESYRFVVEHTPYNFLYFSFLSKLFPNSKFIHIKRNPLDIVSSYTTMKWGSIHQIRNAENIISLYSKWLESVKDFDFLEIKMEELILDREKIGSEISNYLGIDKMGLNLNLIKKSKGNIGRYKNIEKTLPAEQFNRLLEISKAIGYNEV